MSTAIALASNQEDYSREKIELIKRTIAVGASDDELQLFLYTARRTGLDPLARQIHMVKRWNSQAKREVASIQTGIDGYRLIADRTGKLAGISDPEYDSESGPRPGKATVTVKKIVDGSVSEFTASARWDEYVQLKKDDQGNYTIPNTMWGKMPYLMLGKCLPYRAKIQTDMGTLMIGEIVLRRLPVNVLSLNEKTGQVEWRPVVNYFRKDGTDVWVKIWAVNGYNGNRCIRVTPEHPILTARGWVEAGSLRNDDRVAALSPTLSDEQHQVILGSLLGDASLSGRKTGANIRHFSETHSVKQANYLRWKFDALQNLSPNMKASKVSAAGVEHDVVKLRTKAVPALFDYARMFYGSGEKKVTPEILEKLGDLGVAVWIMDDGCIRCDGSTDKSRPFIRLATCSFSASEQVLMQAFFRKKYGVHPSVERIETTPNLRFSTGDADILLTALAAFIRHDRVKNSKEWTGGEVDLGLRNGVVFVPIIKLETWKGKELEGRYDIEVEQNHNFLYNGIVVHNCAEALALRKAFPADLSGVYTFEEMGQAANGQDDDEGQHHQRSNKPPVTQPTRTSDKPTAQPEGHQKTQGNGLETISGVMLSAKLNGKKTSMWIKVGEDLLVAEGERIHEEMAEGNYLSVKVKEHHHDKVGKYFKIIEVLKCESVQDGTAEPQQESGGGLAAFEAESGTAAPAEKEDTLGDLFASGAVKKGTADLPAHDPAVIGIKRAQRLHVLITQNHKKTGFTEEQLKVIQGKIGTELGIDLTHLRDLPVAMYETLEKYCTGEMTDWKTDAQ